MTTKEIEILLVDTDGESADHINNLKIPAVRAKCCGPYEAKEMIRERKIRADLVIVSHKIPRWAEIVSQFTENLEDVPVVVLANNLLGLKEVAYLAKKNGACDLLLMPFGSERLEDLLGAREMYIMPPKASEVLKSMLVGDCAAMKKLRSEVYTAAWAPHPLLITGELGSGKGQIVAAIAKLTGKKVTRVEISKFPKELVESELFGYAKDAFTGAKSEHIGYLEKADGGILFLDEIGNISKETQSKLLTFTQDKTLSKVGSTDEIRVDCRLIFATNVEIVKAIGNGEFREDLFSRMDVFRIHTPPLRERPEDRLPLAKHFIEKYSDRPMNLSQDGQIWISTQDFPANVRGLENAIKRGTKQSKGTFISAVHMASGVEEIGEGTGTSTTPIHDVKNHTDKSSVTIQLLPASDGLESSSITISAGPNLFKSSLDEIEEAVISGIHFLSIKEGLSKGETFPSLVKLSKKHRKTLLDRWQLARKHFPALPPPGE